MFNITSVTNPVEEESGAWLAGVGQGRLNRRCARNLGNYLALES